MKAKTTWIYRTSPTYKDGRVVGYDKYKVKAKMVQCEGGVKVGTILWETKVSI